MHTKVDMVLDLFLRETHTGMEVMQHLEQGPCKAVSATTSFVCGFGRKHGERY